MELRFDPKTMKYLRETLRETKCQEESMETIVPDSYPDVDRILCGSAVLVMRSKECRPGGASASGGIRANIMYMAEGEKVPRCLEVYLPFTVKSDNPELQEDSRIIFRANVRSVDARMLNSRKIAVRVSFCWTMMAFQTHEEVIQTLEQRPSCLQTHEVEYPMTLPAETAERSFQMTEDIQMPAGRPLQGSVYRFSPRLEITEQRLAGNKAVFKGIVHFSALYGTGDDKLATMTAEFPFSQYCELADVYDEEDVSLYMMLTGCELDRTVRQEGEGLLLTLHLLAQCVVNRRYNVQLVEDAYCLGGELMPQWQQLTFVNHLDQQEMSRTVRESRDGSVSDVADVWAEADPVIQSRSATGLELTVPSTATVLYYDGAGDLQSMTLRSESRETLDLAENARSYTSAAVAGDVVAIPTGNGVELRYPIRVTADSIANGTYTNLSGGEIREQPALGGQRPAVIARRTRSGERLWDIAKANGTTVEQIRRANGMTSEVTDAGVILIPT